jgi:hypothetical protein
MFLLCIKTAAVLFLLDLACVFSFSPSVPFEINRAIMRDWRAEAEFHQKKNGERERDKRTCG